MSSFSPAVSSAAFGYHPHLIYPLEATGDGRRRTATRAYAQASRGRMRMAPRNRVLMFGKIRELALYRAEVLRAHGFSVAIPDSEAEAVAAVQHGGFDVAVLTYTLSNDTVEELTELLRQHWPDCRLVTISETKYPDPKINPDANVLADDGPKALIEALRETLKHG